MPLNNLIIFPPKGKIIFIGDTHGDIEASKKVINDYLKENHTLVWLGDYVDRGDYSKENIDFLLENKKRHPGQIYLLLGNHETFMKNSFGPAEFWFKLSEQEREHYSKIFDTFPLVFSSGTIIALHGTLPDVPSLEAITEIQERSDDWRKIVWGDFVEENNEAPFWFNEMRPCCGTPYFNRSLSKLDKKILIRSHQYNAEERMFNNRCLTIFTSNAYRRKRTIAIADMSKTIETLNDIEIVEI